MKKLTVCGVNIAEFTIVVPETPHPAEKSAADFLQRVIRLSCGVTLPISDKKTAHSMVIGSSETNPAIKWDGFRLAADEANVYLHGNIHRGTLYAAYDFAEKVLGYRYFADDCEVIPTEGDADVPANLNIIDNPVFEARRTSCWQPRISKGVCVHGRFNNVHSLPDPLGEEYGGEIAVTGDNHSLGRLCPASRYFEEHPEYYAIHDGNRYPTEPGGGGNGQLCLTNPDVLRIVTENLLAEIRKNPAQPIVEVSQCDNHNFCQCDACRAVDEEEGSHAGTMIRFVNAVAEAVEKEFPNVLVRTFAYQYTRVPPKITKARHNVLVRYCTIEACFRHPLYDENCQKNGGIFRTELEGWGKMAHQISVWDYTTNWACFSAPFPNLYVLRDNARFFAENNAIHIYEECNEGTNGGLTPELKAYLIGKLLWNPYMSEEEYQAHIEDFMSHFYGKGWGEILRVNDILMETTKDRCVGCFEHADIGAAYFNTDVVVVPDIKNFLRINFRPLPYQPAYPGNYLTEFCGHLEEAFALFDRAYALAETDAERFHIRKSRCSLEYTDLFIKSRVKSKLTAEEQKEYEARVDRFYEDMKTYKFRLNIWTSNSQKR